MLTGVALKKLEFTPHKVFDLIVNGEKTTRFRVTLVGVTGLPDSGKTTLVQKLIPTSTRQKSIEGLSLFEIGYCATSKRDTMAVQWEEFTREDIYMYMLTRALTNETRIQELLPELEEWKDDSLPEKCFPSQHIRTRFKDMYIKMRQALMKFSESESDTRFHVLADPTYVLLNVWDIGVSRALHEAFPLLARLTYPLVLVNVLNLSRDFGENLRKAPDLKDIHREQSVMVGRSRAHYYTRIAGLCKSEGRCILIATHKDKVKPQDRVGRVRELEAAIRAKAGDVGVVSLYPEMLAIDVNNKEDCARVKQCLEDLVNSDQKFNKDLQLNWIFLRTALIGYESESDFRMSREEFDQLAQQCGLKTKKEIDECLEFFTGVGSLLYHSLYFRENVIYNPYIFFQKLNILYNHSAGQKSTHAKESLKYGILCKTVATELWDTKSGDKDFFWHLLQDSGVAASTCDLNLKCPYHECNDRDCLFISSVCKERMYRDSSSNMKLDSIFITFNAQYVPADIQALFVKYVPLYFTGVQLKITDYYNFTEFELPENRGSFKVVIHGDVVEIITDKTIQENVEMLSVLKTVCVKILDTVLKYFPGFEYQLGFLCPESKIEKRCPPNNSKISYLYFIPSQYETHLFCRMCEEFHKLTDGQTKWMKAFIMVLTYNVHTYIPSLPINFLK